MAAKTHCPKGHPYEGDNLYVDKVNGNRKCRVCQRERMRRYRQRGQSGTGDVAE